MKEQKQDDDLEAYLLLILSDSALPTGGFVASSGLESFVQHGFITASSFSLSSFLLHSLVSYAQLNLPFFRKAHAAVSALKKNEAGARLDNTVETILATDAELEIMMLNHVTRRASKAQVSSAPAKVMDDLIAALKKASRKPVTLQGHLPVCFAVLTAALGLSLPRSIHLHLFLQARAILSSAVRLNLLGPYAAQRVLLSEVREIVDKAIKEYEARRSEEADESGPVTTWPLGEILAARHDQLHSRIFNS